MSSDAKPGEESAVGDHTRQVSAQMEKPYPMNEQGEILANSHGAGLCGGTFACINQPWLGAYTVPY